MPGLIQFSLIKAADRRYFVVGEWESHDALAAARPQMIGMLDRIRGYLEDLGNGLGLTDPISGETVLTLK